MYAIVGASTKVTPSLFFPFSGFQIIFVLVELYSLLSINSKWLKNMVNTTL